MDAIYSTWFATDTVHVEIDLEEKDEFLTAQEIAELTGAPRNSHILVSANDGVIGFKVSNEIFSEDMSGSSC